MAALWAKLNYEVLEENGLLGSLAFICGPGRPEVSRYSMLMWAGDQNVDWSLDDGLASVIVAALSSGMTATACTRATWVATPRCSI
jgi:alpha-glucosidase